MAVSISGLCRNIKNVAHNYTDAQVKVREATSNDPWGPSSTQMGEIADLTYNVVAFTEIMQMVWKRLNDHGKNWRHVYKSLVLLEYLIKTGSEKVAQQCKENIFVVQTLKDFQHLEDNKDLGINVREKAKTVVALLRDDERLKNERVRALKAKERFAQSQAGIGSDTVYYQQQTDGGSVLPQQPNLDYSTDLTSEIEAARPQTVGEEALQLQLALAMSREEAEQEETKIRSDDMRLQLALKKSKETSSLDPIDDNSGKRSKSKPSAELLELGDLDFGNNLVQQPTQRSIATLGDSWNFNQPAPNDPWGTTVSSPPQATNILTETSNDPWSPVKSFSKPKAQFGSNNLQDNDPWKSSSLSSTIAANPESAFSAFRAIPETSQTRSNPGLFDSHADTFSIDPFAPLAQKELLDYDLRRGEIENRNDPFQVSQQQNLFGPAPVISPLPNPFNLNEMKAGLPETGAKPKKGVASLIEEHSNLVNLDNLLSTNKAPVGNPFEQQQVNPFQAAKPAKPSMNELLPGPNTSGWPSTTSAPQQDFNPFF